MDGICTIFSGIPQDPKEVEGLTHDEKYRHYVNAGNPHDHCWHLGRILPRMPAIIVRTGNDPRTGGKEKLNLGKTSDLVGDGRPEPGRSCEVVGENGGVPLFNDPDCQLGIGSFTAFVFACLNDQTKEGCGQTSLLRGAHHSAERFYRMQADLGGIIGIEGPGWPRINSAADNGLGLNYLPDPIYREVSAATVGLGCGCSGRLTIAANSSPTRSDLGRWSARRTAVSGRGPRSA